MTSMELMQCIGQVKGSYILEAQESNIAKSKSSTGRIKRAWLIAAVITLTLLLVGCAVVYVLKLQDMAFGEREQTYYDGSSQRRTLLSIQGVEGTPGYLATKEWYEWLQSYDTDESVYHSEEAFSEDFGDDYYAYNLYSREMKDKLDEICAKYGLELLGKIYVDPDIEAGCKALQIPGIFRSDAKVEANWDSIHYYANGSYDLEGYVSLNGKSQHIVSYRCHRQNAFSNLYDSIGPKGTYEEWNYTTSYGVDVLMVIDYGGVRGNASMFVERGEYVYLFGIAEFDDMPLPDQEELEAYADAFDFTVQPQRVNDADLAAADQRREEADDVFAADQEKRMHSFSELGYEDRIKFQLEYAVNPELLGFAVMDLEGNGSEELLVGENGYIRAVYTTVDGGSQHMMPLGLMYTNAVNFGNEKRLGEYGIASTTYIYLCEGNSLAYVFDFVGEGMAYHFASVKNGKLVWSDRILYDPDNPYYAGQPWQRIDEHNNMSPISEEEFYRVVNSYHRVSLDMIPISEYPLTDNSPSGIGNPPASYDNFNDLIQRRPDFGLDCSNWAYQLIDLDGDGTQELILKDGSWTGIFAMKDGQVKQLIGGVDVKLCEGNIIAVTRAYLDGNKTYSYYKIVDGNTVLTDYLRYDADRNPSSPWFISHDGTGQDTSLCSVSEQEFHRILESYKPLKMNMKPIPEYPAS